MGWRVVLQVLLLQCFGCASALLRLGIYCLWFRICREGQAWPALSDGLAFGQPTRAFLVQTGGARTRAGHADAQTTHADYPRLPFGSPRRPQNTHSMLGLPTDAKLSQIRCSARIHPHEITVAYCLLLATQCRLPDTPGLLPLPCSASSQEDLQPYVLYLAGGRFRAGPDFVVRSGNKARAV